MKLRGIHSQIFRLHSLLHYLQTDVSYHSMTNRNESGNPLSCSNSSILYMGDKLIVFESKI